MKPAPFHYHAPTTLPAALDLLGEDARALAGGQSLIPLMNLRLVRPARVVDLNRIASLSFLRRREGTLRLGATTRHAALEHSALVAGEWPLLGQAVRRVGHPAIRARGTIGGSCAHADPAAELPVALAALDARFHLRSRAEARTLDASEFFISPLTTALHAGELLVEIEVPAPPPQARSAFAEHRLARGEWAVCGAAVVVAPGHAAIALLGAGPTPLRASAAEAAIRDGASAAVASALAGALIDDDWRGALTAAMVRRALEQAA